MAITITMTGTIMMTIPDSYADTFTSHLSVSGADNYNKQISLQQDRMWYLGKNLAVGDSYTYKVCDPGSIQTSAANYHYFIQGNEDHNSSVCYNIKLDFVNLLNSDENQISGNIWVVQATINDVAENRDNVRYSIFHIDTQTFEVRTDDTIHPDTIKYADSLQKTLFSLFKYTANEPQLLQTGVQWGEVTEALYEKGTNQYMTIIDNNQEYSVIQNYVNHLNHQNVSVERNIVDAFQVGYEIDIVDPLILDDGNKNKTGKEMDEDDNNNVTNSFLIYSDLPFPISAVSYSPVHIIQPQKQFEFELLEFLANSKNINMETKSVFEEPVSTVVADDELTETGVIELTFPDDMITDTSNEDAETTSVFEKPTTVIVEEPIIDESIVDDEGTGDEKKPTVTKGPVIENSLEQDDTDYSKTVGLGILLIAMTAGFVVFKKLRYGKLGTNPMKKTLKETEIAKKKTNITIPFEEKLHIDIKTLTDKDI